MPIKINGSTSGYTEIKAADAAANNTLTLPSASGTLMTTGGSNTFTANQIISVTDNTNAALRVTQLGTADAIRVEDSTNPDSTPFVVDASGNVGIGTSSPSAKLDVAGVIKTNSSVNVANTSGLTLADDISGGFLSYGYSGSRANAAGHRWYNGLTSEVMRIDSAGNIGLGGSVPPSGTQLNSIISAYGIFCGANQTNIAQNAYYSSGWKYIQSGAAALLLQNAGYFSFQTAGSGSAGAAMGLSEKFVISNNGVLYSQATYDNTATGSTVIVTSSGEIRRTSSSIKYKKDVETLDSALVDNAIANLRPVWYRTKNAEGDDKQTWSHIGLVAEEVDQVEKRLVRYKTVEVTKGEDGNRVETLLATPEPEDVDYARLSVLLLDKVKRQDAAIAILESRITALEGGAA